ncbi:uncharacterized protein STEHIDRAFT_140001 [Stereum hirsutum FP-91666 SS1]|uniref:uncharacterized protein n=1 Tax=Stereum hirsutum (strain FP-91666) TaxID=721885 RepID=UPI0004449665|nr:uncharacterized protein STEHIDRAFT_140001 [Stereum hirsutum FP-91666 SS1]EIM85273.1 hypothetical protein STEHIDRAFT_140001 [Stereum hirsutum FP-91666 SS1]
MQLITGLLGQDAHQVMDIPRIAVIGGQSDQRTQGQWYSYSLLDFAGLSRSELQQLLRDDHDMLKFSKNILCIDIKDPHATDLSFIDLPGLIQNEDLEVVDLVKHLAVSNITNESTIILVTIPVTDEMENQLAFRLAREADPEGKRTVVSVGAGVLTKPDNLRDGDVGARERWKDVIEGKSHQLKHGYYCVRLPDDAQRQRNIKPIEAKEFARTFFTSSAPWSQLGPADRRRLGVPNLVSDLSRPLIPLSSPLISERHIAWEHLGYIPFEAPKKLLEASIKLWEVLSRMCLESAFSTLGVTLEGLVKKYFSQFTRIDAAVQNVVRTELEEIRDIAANDVRRTLQQEHWPFWTQNDHYFECTKLKSSVSIQARQTQELQALAALGYESICAEDFHRLWPPDRYEEELRVMAGARAYFQVAYKRIIDHIPMTIEHSMNQPFADNLHAALLSALDIASSVIQDGIVERGPRHSEKQGGAGADEGASR